MMRLTQCLCVLLCNLITCYAVDSAWFQLLKLTYNKLVSSFSFKSNLRRYTAEAQQRIEEEIRQKNVNENYETAMDTTPEAFGSVIMLYVDMEVNGQAGGFLRTSTRPTLNR